MWYDWTTHDHTSHWILKVLTFHRDLSLQCHGALFFFSFGHVDHLAVFGLFDQRNSNETLLYRGLVIGTKGFSVPCDLVRPKRAHLAMIITSHLANSLFKKSDQNVWKKAGCLLSQNPPKSNIFGHPNVSNPCSCPIKSLRNPRLPLNNIWWHYKSADVRLLHILIQCKFFLV